MLNEKEEKKAAREITPWRPFSDLSRFERDMERRFGGFFERPWFGLKLPQRLGEIGFREPAIEVYEEKDDVVVKAEIPGIKKEELEVNITDDLLTTKGEKKKEEEVKEKGYYYSERSYGSFERSIQIPRAVHADKARAIFKDGILEIRLPKTEEAKRKEVKLKVE
ncbi:MAG TPA: Hsp20/alpha crystallin family protein [Methylococcaceae bacterium]|jgi:HSP20 family protein|nr:Hsp20/alpha crystallin family protein [Methylococcaceae bacterium]